MTAKEHIEFDLRYAKWQPILVGIAVSPATNAVLDREALNPPGIGQIPILIDPRMTRDASEAYYNLDAWKERRKEQAAWDEKTTGGNTI